METKLKDVMRRRRRLLLRMFGAAAGAEVLAWLEERFECGLPCFQGQAGGYDALDAMRRDAYREVLLYVRQQLQLAKDESGEDEEVEG